MLKTLKPYELKDYVRDFQGDRGYMPPVAPNNRALQWYGMYPDKERTIVYFIARKIENKDYVVESYQIDTGRIKYESGQYLYDETLLFDGTLPEGCYYFEVNDGFNSFFTELFCVKNLCQLLRCSSSQLASSSTLISELCVKNPNVIVLKQFEQSDYYEFDNI